MVCLQRVAYWITPQATSAVTSFDLIRLLYLNVMSTNRFLQIEMHGLKRVVSSTKIIHSCHEAEKPFPDVLISFEVILSEVISLHWLSLSILF